MKINLDGNNKQRISELLNERKELEQSGYYKWFINKKDFEIIKYVLDLSQDQINHIEKKNNKYCIYVGVAVGENLKNRLKRHIFGNEKCSTLRKSISAILINDDIKTNDFIGRMEIEYYNEENNLLDIEKSKINEFYRPINIQKNNYEINNLFNETKRVKNTLKALRRNIF